MAARNLETIVNELADREAIRALPQRYCDSVWRGDVAGVVDLFTEDGSFTVSGSSRDRAAHGRSELRKTYRSDFSSITPRRYIHNHVIELKDKGRGADRPTSKFVLGRIT